jgi:hypothetical protein
MLIGRFVHRQQDLPAVEGISTTLMSPQIGRGMTNFAQVIHAMYTSTYIVNLPSVPKFCAANLVCKVACTLSGNSYITCQASSASPCAHALTASLDSEVHLGHASGAIQHAAPQSDVNEI